LWREHLARYQAAHPGLTSDEAAVLRQVWRTVPGWWRRGDYGALTWRGGVSGTGHAVRIPGQSRQTPSPLGVFMGFGEYRPHSFGAAGHMKYFAHLPAVAALVLA